MPVPVTTITAVESTDLFVGPEEAPRQILRVAVEGPAARITVSGAGVHGEATGTGLVEVPLEITGASPGDRLPVTVRVSSVSEDALVEVAEPGWTMFLVSHFHYDPVWWNTQAAYTSPWELLSADATTRPLWERNGFALVDAHLDLALRDPVYKFVLAEVDYLKPYFDQHPERRETLRMLLERGQVELVGGTYNEPNTNLTGAETTIRNIVHGIGYQRDILGGDPRTAWQLDVFGHDPQFPGHLAAAGLTGSAWARGPFHQWGPIQKNFREGKDDARVMQFPSEFEWIAPGGEGVLTHYMPHHYSAGWWMDSSSDLAAAEQAVYELYRKLKPVGATKNLLLPVGTDYTPPNKWVTEIHRSWAAKYLWPRFVCATPRDFLDAVRAELATLGRRPSPQTRDMNPVYTGKDVSYIDTKQAGRAGEVAAVDAEKLATLAVVNGLGSYPAAALDKVWRQLAYGAHHDAITGSESDQVYLDLLGGWREAYDLASAVRDAALDALTARISTVGAGSAVVVTNTLSFDRTDLVAVELPCGAPPVRVLDEAGWPVPSAVDRGTLRFLAEDVPALGWRTWRLVPGEPADAWTATAGATITNGRYRVTADPARGGGLSSVHDLMHERELIQEGRLGNELRVYEEYPQHPDFGEGPWHLVPSGPVIGSGAVAAEVRRETGPLGERLVIGGTVDGVRYEQTVTLWRGLDRVDCRTRVVDYSGADRLLRLRFPVDVPGGLPVSEVAGAVIGRGFAMPDVDSAQAPWTLDNPANTWFGLGATARTVLTDAAGGVVGSRALGVAEVIVPSLDDAAEARPLVVALARVGVTATTSAADWARYGWLDVDSNLPDFRIVVGGPEVNEAARELIERAGEEYAAVLKAHGAVWVPALTPLAEVWRPDADLRDLRVLPALVVSDVPALVDDLADARITAVCPSSVADQLADHTVALLSFGLPGFAVDATGALHLSLMRSCTGWPSGVWIDPPRRSLPDQASFQLQHWTHEFSYALVGGDGDWRDQTLPARGQEFNHPLYTRIVDAQDGPLPGTLSWLRVEPQRQVLLGALKPAGNPIAHGSAPSERNDDLTVRLVESTGLGRTAQLGGALGLDRLRHADLLERPLGPADLGLAGAQIATLLAAPAMAAAPADGPVLGPAAEPAQPVHARYWLHNRGPAPLGYLPVSVGASPGLLRTAGEAVTFSVALSSQLRDAAVEGTAVVLPPEGWATSLGSRPYRLEPGGHLRFPVTLTRTADAEPGLHFAAVRIEHDGQQIEDVVTIAVGDLPELLPVAGDAPEDWTAAQGTKAATGRDTGLDLAVSDEVLRVAPGGRAALGLTLTNRTRGEIRGELQLVSPWGTWEAIADPVRGFAVPAGSSVTADFAIAAPEAMDPGSYWALAKVMWFGRCQYAPTVALVVEA
ncbi:glycoside hydrolase family 38 N-terminal domain-containing protein [Kitasatospora cathayae]|uniref:NEW3 domain-containing protein n=1 Tax=Kitasatospora cathayae TaxID=3004092 RepID=A0ABY7QBU9_9ACTN|nr:glycoside hydrolase family 38 C-terminal domain-containing protein [Kitasatospora sp. HUAS 3-15]WBP90253.1 NEW3 domain-containing protein [Kitasatospora sp. HUAS 3-15]